MRKKITVIGNHFAFDEINGYTRALGLYEALSKKYDIDILVPRELDIYPDKVEPLGQNMTLRSIAADPSHLEAGNGERFHELSKNPALRRRLKEAMSSADLIMCEGLFYVSLAKDLFPEKTVIFRSLHVEYDQIFWRNQHTDDQHTDDPNLQSYMDGTFNLEKKACEDADWIVALTEYDGSRLCELYGVQKEKVHVIPLCFSEAVLSRNYIPKRRGHRKALYMSACPIDSPEYLVSITKSLPEIEFHIVGKGGYDLQGYGPNVIVHGVVSEDELQRIEADCDFAWNLTHMAAGMNSKVMDYFSSGIPAICNESGARGYQAKPGEHYFPAEFDTFEKDLQAFLALSDEERYQIALNAFYHVCNTLNYANYTPFIDSLVAGDKGEDCVSSYYIFGAGLYGRAAFYELEKQGKLCIGFVDNNSKRWGELYCGVKIISPEEAFRTLRANGDMRLMIGVSTQYLGAIVRQAASEIGTKQMSVYGISEINLNKVMSVR